MSIKKYSCPKCGKGYETQGKYYKTHIQECTGSVFKKPSRPKITGAMRLAVWETYIGQSTKIVNRSNGEVTKGRIPPYSVVVPGTYKDLYAVHIIKTVDSKTRSKTSINDLLRD